MDREQAITHVIGIEQGYVNDGDDSGGATRYGITERVARRWGYKGDMRDLPYQTARDIFAKEYWHSLSLDTITEMSGKIAQEVFDTGVNAGILRSAEFLQRSLNVLNNRGAYYPDLVVDGHIGKMTCAALHAYLTKRKHRGEEVLFQMLNCLQGEFYVTLAERREKDEKFVYGWFDKRIE
jgi:lysozyme family protein